MWTVLRLVGGGSLTSERGRVLVTGATGFIGRALVGALLREGVRVTAAVRREAMFEPGVRVVRVGDIGPSTDWRDALAGPLAVVHCGARVHVRSDGATDPLTEYRKVNVAGTLGLAEQAVAAGVRRFVFVSSVKVNGESTRDGQAFTERDPPAPVDPYGISKAEAEAGLLASLSSGPMEIVVIRPPLVYGPGVGANFRTMARWLERGIPLPLGAVHHNRRSLVGLDNLVSLILACLDHPGAANQVFLAGDGEDLSTTELLQRTAAAIGVRARLVPVPVSLLTGAARLIGQAELAERLCGSLQVDISKARRVLGWNPQISVDEGLRRAVRGLRERKAVV